MPIVSIVLFVFGGALLLYGLIAMITKEIIVPINRQSSVEGISKEYAFKLAKLIAFLSIAPIIGGVFGLFIKLALIPVIIFVVLLFY